MTRFGIDHLTALRLAREQQSVAVHHQLVAPNVLRSQGLSDIYAEFRDGIIDREESRRLMDGITTLKIRLLGDRVSRGTAFRIADELGLDDTRLAEYVAVAKLQADAFITLDADLAKRVAGIVPLANFDDLLD